MGVSVMVTDTEEKRKIQDGMRSPLTLIKKSKLELTIRVWMVKDTKF